jgi:hypothetical protein
MSEQEQAQHLVNELTAVIDRFRSEYDINYATAIGCLEIIKMDLYREGVEDDD